MPHLSDNPLKTIQRESYDSLFFYFAMSYFFRILVLT